MRALDKVELNIVSGGIITNSYLLTSKADRNETTDMTMMIGSAIIAFAVYTLDQCYFDGAISESIIRYMVKDGTVTLA